MIDRYEKLDVLRAIAIILVVFGHSIILYSTQWNLYESPYSVPALDIVKRWINLIQMPLFFFLSGFLFFFSYPKMTLKKLLYKKSVRLLLPYICFAVFWLLPIRLILKYPYYQNKKLLSIFIKCILFGRDNGHLWYLYSLFICFVCSFSLLKILNCVRSKKNSAIILLVVSMTLFLIPAKYNYFKFCGYFFWFILGFITAVFNLEMQGGGYKMVYILIFILSSFLGVKSQNFLLTTFCSLGLVMSLFFLVPNRSNFLVNFLAKNSFGIYLFHSPLIYITFTFLSTLKPLYVVLINFIGFGVISILLLQLLRMTKLKFMMGE